MSATPLPHSAFFPDRCACSLAVATLLWMKDSQSIYASELRSNLGGRRRHRPLGAPPHSSALTILQGVQPPA